MKLPFLLVTSTAAIVLLLSFLEAGPTRQYATQRAKQQVTGQLDSLRRYVADEFMLLALYKTRDEAYTYLTHQVGKSITYCEQHADFDQFDRAYFLRTYLNPLSASLLDFQQQLGIAPLTDQRPLRSTAWTLFDPAAFDANYYATTADQQTTPARVALGRQLFTDPILSGDGTRTCATCHQPDRAFTDGLRNTPTLLNAALQAGMFYDLRTKSLESQAADVVHNRAEMAGSMVAAARNMQADGGYVAAFRKAFPAAMGPISPG